MPGRCQLLDGWRFRWGWRGQAGRIRWLGRRKLGLGGGWRRPEGVRRRKKGVDSQRRGYGRRRFAQLLDRKGRSAHLTFLQWEDWSADIPVGPAKGL